MRLFWDNWLDLAATTISSQSEVATLPDDNVAHAHKGKVYRTGTSQAAEWIKFDLGSAKAVDGFVLFAHTLDGSDSAINIEGHTADTWGSPDVTASLSVSSEGETAVQKWSSAQSKQWWRLEFTKAAAGDEIDIGRLFLGDVYDFTTSPDYVGYDDEVIDPSPQQKSIAGQSFSYIKNPFDRLRVTFKSMTLAEAIQLRTIYRALGTHTPLFIQIDPDASDGIREAVHYVKFTKALKRKVAGVDSGLLFDVVLEFEQQL